MKPKGKEQGTITGTDSDLRKLSIKEAHKVLMMLGARPPYHRCTHSH